MTITAPGVYTDLSEHDYHAQHDWLSWSRMKYLIPPSTPAHYQANLRAGEERKRHFDLGKVVHRLVLGDGATYVIVQAARRDKSRYDAKDYDLVSAQRHRDEIYDAGLTPILRHELDQAKAMADAIRRHRIARVLLSDGTPEVSLFWVDPETGVKCRARLDWLPNAAPGRRLIVPDVKSAITAAPSEFAKAGARFGYYGQAEHYRQGIMHTGLHDDPAVVFVCVEKRDPYLVSVAQFADPEDVRLARAAVDRARRLYAECVTSDTWPGYPEVVADLSLPTWLHFDLAEFVA